MAENSDNVKVDTVVEDVAKSRAPKKKIARKKVARKKASDILWNMKKNTDVKNIAAA